jgi:hypothetical protein
MVVWREPWGLHIVEEKRMDLSSALHRYGKFNSDLAFPALD